MKFEKIVGKIHSFDVLAFYKKTVIVLWMNKPDRLLRLRNYTGLGMRVDSNLSIIF